MAEWSFLTNHARALVCIAHDPGVRLRDIAKTLDITERSAYSIAGEASDATPTADARSHPPCRSDAIAQLGRAALCAVVLERGSRGVIAVEA